MLVLTNKEPVLQNRRSEDVLPGIRLLLMALSYRAWVTGLAEVEAQIMQTNLSQDPVGLSIKPERIQLLQVGLGTYLSDLGSLQSKGYHDRKEVE